MATRNDPGLGFLWRAADRIYPEERLSPEADVRQHLQGATFVVVGLVAVGIVILGVAVWAGATSRMWLITGAVLASGANVAVLRRSLDVRRAGFVLAAIGLVLWGLDALALGGFASPTLDGLYIVPLLAWLTAGARAAAVFGAAVAVTFVLIWFATGTYIGPPQITGEAYRTVMLAERIGLVVVLAAWMMVVGANQRFLARLLQSTRRSVEVDVERIQLIERRLDQNTQAAEIGATLASAAHDLSNPLTYAQANLDLCDTDTPPEERRELLQQAHEGLLRMQALVRELGRVHQEQAAVAVVDIVQGALRTTRSLVEARARLVVEPVDAGLFVFVVENRLIQVLVNLLTNAVQSIPPGRAPEHEIRVSVVDDGERIDILVADSGAGVPPDIADRIFEPFFTTKHVSGGTGLGLAICQRLVQEAGGVIHLEPRPEGGTVARIRLCRLHRANTRRAEVGPPEAAVHAPPASPAPRVLVVDDEQDILRLLERGLVDMRVTTLGVGREAVRRCQAERFDVVICDLMMPDMTGIDVYRAVVEGAPELEPRFLFVTGGVFSDEARRFVAEMGDRVLHKPFTLPQVRARVVRLARDLEAM